MKLTKTIPERKKTVKFKWAYRDSMQATAGYFKARNSLSGKRRGTMTKCDWCQKKFKKDEWFALAQPEQGQTGPTRNWCLCDDCAKSIGAPRR